MFGTGADYYDPFKNKFLLLALIPGIPSGLSSDSNLGDSRG